MLMLLVFAPSIALAADSPALPGPESPSPPENPLGTVSELPQGVSGPPNYSSSPNCRVYSLTPQESQNILDLRRQSLGFDELNAGTEPDPYRKTLDNSNALIPDTAGELAIKQDFPNKEIRPEEVSWMFPLGGKGAFAVGVVLEDTLRIGKCEGDAKDSCSVRDKGLTFKNDGEGIVSDFKNAAGILTEKLSSSSKDSPIDQKTLDYLAAEAEMSAPPTQEPDESGPLDYKEQFQKFKDTNFSIKTALRFSTDGLKNRIEAQDFEAGMGTTCQNSSCVINTYSLFDKYFNSMFSTGLVLSNLAPTLVGKAAYLFDSAKTRGWKFPFSETIYNWKNKTASTFLKPSEVLPSTVEKYDFAMRKYGGRGLDAVNDLYSKDPILLGDGAYAGWQAKFFSESYPKITEYEVKRALVDQAALVQKYSRTMKAMKNFTLAEKNAGRITQTEAGQQIAVLMKDLDDGATHFSMPAEFMKNERHGLNEYFVKPTQSSQYARVTHQNIADNMLKEFADNARFGSTFEADATGALKVYKFNPVGQPVSAGVPFDTFEASVRGGQYANQQVAVQLNNGSYMPVDVSSLDYIRNNTSGTVNVFKGTIDDAGVITSEDFSGRILEWVPSRIDAHERNIGKFVDTLRERGAASRRYFSLLDKQLLEEESLVKNYLGSFKGAAKWTAIPFAYSWAKKGVGVDSVSAYRLPDSWTEIHMTQGSDRIFNDAYVDFFANAGSDMGDIFTQLLNKLPWKGLVIDPLSESVLPDSIKNWLDKASGKSFRSDVEDLAVFIYGPRKECSSCTASLDSKTMKDFTFVFTTHESLNGFIFEDAQSKEARENGQTIVSYAHHLNLQGKPQGNSIDIVQARRDKTTCSDAMQSAMLGFDLDPRTAAAILSGAEAAGYALFGMAGMFGSFAQQVFIAQEFNECVDDREGYYVHYFVPTNEQQQGRESSATAGAEKASDIIKSGQDAMQSLFTGSSEKVDITTRADEAKAQGLSAEELQQKEGGQGVLSNAMDRIKEGTQNVISKVQDKDILQANFSTQGAASGQTYSERLFWFWFEGGKEWSPVRYKTQGVTNYVDSNGNTLKSDFEKGQISMNGKVIVNADGSRPEFQRLEQLNLRVPAKEIPQRLSSARLPEPGSLMFEMNAQGEVFVTDPQVKACIEEAVMSQSGVRLYSYNLAHTFGLANFMQTESARVTPSTTGDGIIVEGALRFVAEGRSSAARVYGSRDVNVSDSLGLSASAGLFESISFENGTIMYNPERNELIIWLRHHEQAIPTTKDVKGMKATLTSDKNPITECDEPAINLSLIPDGTSEKSMEKVENFNAGMALNGPFKVFETDKAVFMFYALPPDCKPRFRMIDKATGEVYDQEIVPGSLKQTENGVEFETADGKNHSMEFSAPDGKPILTYNGDPQNLLSAQGRNGSFYFDPNTGEYFAENGQFIPLNEKFKQGISPTVNPDGTVSGVPASNPFAPGTSTAGGNNGLFNLPSLPEELLLLLLFLCCIATSIVLVRFRK